MEIINRKAKYEYSFIDTYVAGIELLGSEVVQIRNGKASIDGCYCYTIDGQIFIKGAYIKNRNKWNGHWWQSKSETERFDEYRDRRLLLHKKEITKLSKGITQPGYTIVLYKIFEQHGLLKAEIALAKGKHEYDKRETIKERESKRELNRIIKNY